MAAAEAGQGMTPDDLADELRAVWAELFLHRPAKPAFGDEVIALGVLMQRKIERELRTRVIEPAYADGYRPEQKYEMDES